jgi:hydroxypyruvate isomerase
VTRTPDPGPRIPDPGSRTPAPAPRLRLSVCLEFFWKDKPLVDRIAAARAAGFDAGEIWGWHGRDLGELRAAADDHDFRFVSVCATEPIPGFNDPAQHARLSDAVRAAFDAADTLGCQQLIVQGGTTLDAPRDAQTTAIVEALAPLAREADARGRFLALESLNSVRAFPNYFMDTAAAQLAVVRQVNHPGLRAVYDLFHAGMMGPNDRDLIVEHLPWIGSFHVAGCPDRQEPFDERDRAILREASRRGFAGYAGLEYAPSGDSDRSLKQTVEWLNA